jgi:predicted transcriptional regulator of viral defense system
MNTFKKGEPIFLDEIPGSSKDVVRQEMKRLTDDNKLERLYNGVYYIPYQTILGTKGKISIDQFIDKKYFLVGGFFVGLSLVNQYGFTSQNSSVYEICSNEATTKQRKYCIDGNNIIVYKPLTTITKENVRELEFLYLMTVIDKFKEIRGSEYQSKLRQYIEKRKIDFEIVKKYLSLFPDVVYKNIYEGGIMNELVW